MQRINGLSRYALAAALIATPVLAVAQTGAATGGTGSTTTPGTIGTTSPSASTTTTGSMGTRADTPSSRNPVLTDAGDVRASKVIGSSVYNDKDEKIGAVDDIIFGRDNMPSTVVLSVGGFLGMGAKLVAVPYDRIKFGDTKTNSDQRVMMPGATKDSLNAMDTYKYASS